MNRFGKYAFFLVILFCIIFPFGQIFRIETEIIGSYVVIHPIDIIALLSLPYLFIDNDNLKLKNANGLIFIFVFTWIISAPIFQQKELISGFLHLIRVVSYYSFYRAVSHIKGGLNLYKILIYSLILFLIFGIVQYIYFYDLRGMFLFGWDDHYYRLTSTLFDPAYSAVVLLLGLILVQETKIIFPKYLKYLLSIIFVIAIILTFSRAGYVALIAYILLKYKKHALKIGVFSFLIFIFLLIIPKPRSSGVELYRMYSITSRLNNYKQAVEVFIKHPLLGVGFNNICQYRLKYLNTDNVISHSCSGSDSSFLLILSTTGVIGFLAVVNLLYMGVVSVKNDKNSNLYMSVIMTVLIGSLFNNVLFYNFIMGISAIIFGLKGRVTHNNIK